MISKKPYFLTKIYDKNLDAFALLVCAFFL